MTPPKPRDSQDPALSRLLQSWQVPTTPAAGFGQGVWRRLESANPATATAPGPWSMLVGWLDDRLRMPFAMPACLAALVAAGVVAGALHGRASSIALTAGLQGRYVQSIDPFAGHVR